MIGTLNSNNLSKITCVLMIALGGHLTADVITLTHSDNRLSGTVRTIDTDGTVELTSESSPEPLKLKNSAVSRIIFNETKDQAPAQPALVELINGDLLPATITNLNNETLTITSPAAGKLDIPRNFIKSIQLGLQSRRMIYSGPKDANEWKSNDTAKNWELQNNGLYTKKSATTSIKLDLPEQFILRFTLKWEAKQSPNFRIFFADPLLETGNPADRYFIQFNNAGFSLQRESSSDKRYSKLKQINRRTADFTTNELRVEMRVDRRTSRIRLLLNDEDEGVIADPIDKAPKGSGITIECNPSADSTLGVHHIEVMEYDDSRGRHKAEDRGKPTSDSLISTDDERWSGRLSEIHTGAKGPIFQFTGDGQKTAMEIPAENVSTVFFAENPESKNTLKKPATTLRIQGEGVLHVSSCKLGDGDAEATHPLLGQVKITRKLLLAIEPSGSSQTNSPK